MRFCRRLLPFVSSLLLFTACGPSGDDDGGGDDDSPATDTDGDTISDGDEGYPDRDTDGDGTPDYQDDDSDDDGVPDYREAGDEDATTAPNDSDSDGTPDFRDTDADDNGRPDGVDGLDDVDGDGRPNFADLDDDGDQMNDAVEIGNDPGDPIDTDDDGTPDFQDTDSDDDGTLDYHEGPLDFDVDGTPNFRDLDSDGDCLLDAVEGGNPPPDTDDDSRYDFLDRDSDNDGLADGQEDANCNGTVDAGESSPGAQDTDGDGVTDLVEVAAGTDPTNNADNPQANGDFVFVVPYEEAPTPDEDDLDFATDLVSVDVYVLIDRSGSMTGEISSVRSNLSAAIDGLQCPPLGTGDPATCIPDLWGGGGTVGYAGSSGQPYGNSIDISPNPNYSVLPTDEPGGCCAETLMFGLWAAITGNGTATAGCSISQSVSARSTCNGSPAQTNGYGTFGYPCFRQGALPVVLLATDEPAFSGGPLACPDQTTVQNAYNNRSGKIVGITGSGVSGTVTTDLEALATGTGAIDAANGNEPLVFPGADANADDAIAEGIRTLANGIPLDISAISVDDPADAVDAVASFVSRLETLQLGTPECANGLSEQDSNADGFPDLYLDVRAGTPVCWKLVPRSNTTVMPTAEPQLFRATIEVYGDGVTVLDTRDVFFLVPPELIDPPID